MISYTIRFKNSRSVTPGIPPITEVSTESKLIGIDTPVKPENKFTAIRTETPEAIERSALFKGRSFFE